MSIVNKRLQTKKEQISNIDQRVENEQITPTERERTTIDKIIYSISEQYSKELTDSEVTKDPRKKKELNDRIVKTIKKEIEGLNLDYEKKRRMEKLAITNIIGLGPLQQYLDDPDITEIVVQRYDNICVEKKGKIYATKTSFADEDTLRNVINRVLQPVGREVNRSSPIVDAHLADGSRICATIPPVSPKGSTLTIRKFNNKMMTAEKYLELKSVSKNILEFLRMCVLGKVSIFVSGGTGTGKTTFLNMLSAYLPENELIVTIEDTLELQLKQKNVRAMETRPIADGNMEDIDMAALVKASLRMRPDRIVVGETRDSAVVSLLEAMSTGHEGSMSTGHANSPKNLVEVRIPTMIERDKSTSFSERAQALMISEALQLIVQLRRLPGGRRVVSQVSEVSGLTDDEKVKINDIFVYDYESDSYKFTGYLPDRIIEHVGYHGIKFNENTFR